MNLFDLSAKLTLDSDEYESGLNRARDMASSIGRGIGTVLKAGAATIGVATTAVAAFGTQAVKSYASYEQLVGGIETLFGTQGMALEEYAEKQGKTIDEVREDYQMLAATQRAVLWDADQAWKTSGMSANEYMETVAGFAASLKQSTDTVEDAGEAANIAIRDMSDNASKMGTSMESIKNAYMGFAKQNYTMLDNLKLGYGGTKTEMERLLKDAQKISGVKYDMSNLADVYEAIHVIQTELGITGTTAKEAMFTIEGSANATKAAWSNVITAIGRGEGLDKALDGMLSSLFGGESGGGMLANMIPRIQQVMTGIADFIGKAGPIFAEKVPGLIESILPSMLSAGISLVGALGKGFMDALPTILYTLGDAVEEILTSLVEATKDGGSFILDIIDWIAGAFEENYTQLFEIGLELVQNILKGIASSDTSILYYVSDIILYFTEAFIEALPQITKLGIQIMDKLADSLGEAIPEVARAIVELIPALIDNAMNALPQLATIGVKILTTIANAVTSNAGKLLETGKNIITRLWKAMMDNLPVLMGKIPEMLNKVGEAIQEALPQVWEMLREALPMLQELGLEMLTALFDNMDEVLEMAVNIVTWLIDGFIGAFPQILDMGVQIIQKLIEGIVNAIPSLVDGAVTIIGRLVEFIISNLGQIVSAGIRIVTALITGLIDAIPSLIAAVPKLILEIVGAIIKSLPEILAAGVDIIAALIEGIASMLGQVVKSIVDIVTEIISTIGGFGAKLIEAGKDVINNFKEGIMNIGQKAAEWGKDLMDNFIGGIKEKWENLKSTVSNIAQTIKDFIGFSEPKEGPLSNFHTYAPDMMKLFAQGIRDNEHLITDQIKKSFDFGEQTIPVKTNITTGRSSIDESGVGNGNQFNFYINDVDATPDEIARDARRELQYMLIGGASLG